MRGCQGQSALHSVRQKRGEGECLSLSPSTRFYLSPSSREAGYAGVEGKKLCMHRNAIAERKYWPTEKSLQAAVALDSSRITRVSLYPVKGASK